MNSIHQCMTYFGNSFNRATTFAKNHKLATAAITVAVAGYIYRNELSDLFNNSPSPMAFRCNLFADRVIQIDEHYNGKICEAFSVDKINKLTEEIKNQKASEILRDLPEYVPGTSIERDLLSGLEYPLSKKCSPEHTSAYRAFEIAYRSTFTRYISEFLNASYCRYSDRFIHKLDDTVLKQWRSEYLKNLTLTSL